MQARTNGRETMAKVATLLSGKGIESITVSEAEVPQPGPGEALVRIAGEGSSLIVTVDCGAMAHEALEMARNAGADVIVVDHHKCISELPETTGTVASDTFATAVGQVAVAAGRDDSLPTLTGVHVDINEETITLAATDRYRLAVREFIWSPATPGFTTQALMRARTLADAAKSLVGVKNVSLSFAPATSHDRLAGFAGDGKSMTSRMLDGTFPPYRHLLPTETSTTAVVEVAPFLDSVRRVALVTDKTVPLRLEFKDGGVSLEAGAGEEAQATETIDVLLNGEPISIAFNPTFLTDGLQAVGTPFVQISFTGNNKPAILTGRTEPNGPSIENYRYLLMPMRYAS